MGSRLIAAAMPGGTTASTVHGLLDADAPAREMLGRGVVNVRAFARWLIEMHGLEASEEAVVSAIRRYTRDRALDGFAGARKVLERCQLTSRSNVCSLVLPRTEEVHQRLHGLFGLVSPSQGEMVRIIEGPRHIKVVVAGENIGRVREVLGTAPVEHMAGDLVEYEIRCPLEASADTPGILSLIFSTLAVHGVNVVETISGPGEILLLVEDRDRLRAYQTIRRLCPSRT